MISLDREWKQQLIINFETKDLTRRNEATRTRLRCD